MEGVKEIKVSSVNRKIHVQYDSSMISEDLIIRKINDLGFEVKREVTDNLFHRPVVKLPMLLLLTKILLGLREPFAMKVG